MSAADVSQTPNSAPAKRGGLIWAITLAAVWFWTFRVLSLWWDFSPAYQYGFVVPWIAIFMAWQRLRRNPGSLDPAPASRARNATSRALMVAAWAVLFLGELLRRIDAMWRPVDWIMIFGATLLTGAWVWRRGGRQLLRELAFPILFTWVALPWPGSIEDPLIMELRAFVTTVTVAALHALGIAAVQHVNVIELAAGPVGVEDACSGIVSFHSSLMAALFLGEFLRLGLLRRVVLVLGGCLVAVAGNLVRTFLLCSLVHREGLSAVGAYHDRLGLVATGVIFAGVLGLAWLLTIRAPRSPETLAGFGVALDLFRRAPGGARGAGLALAAFAALPLISFAWFAYRPSGGEKLQEAPLWALQPQRVPNGWLAEPIEIPPWQRDTLGFSQGQGQRLIGAGSVIQVFHFFWGAERSGLPYAHTPDICMSYIGWKQKAPPRKVDLRLGDGIHPARSFCFELDGTEITALHTFWRGGEPGLTGSDMLDDRRLARLPLLLRGPRLFGMEELLIFVHAPGDEDTHIRLAEAVLQKVLTETGNSAPDASTAAP